MTTSVRPMNPPDWERPSGYSHAVVAGPGQFVSIAGQISPSAPQEDVVDRFVVQFDGALAKILHVLARCGGEPAHITSMTVYVTSLDTYRRSASRLTDVWHRRMGRHYPAMTLVGVTGLVDPDAAVEINAVAVVPPA